MNIDRWLEGMGLRQYAELFRSNDVDGELLHRLTGDDLKEIGVTSFGHRKKLLDAIAALSAAPETLSHAAAATFKGSAPERRQLTVMFVDLVGSTALSKELDPEDLREVLGEYRRRITVALSAAGGYIAQHLGDGIMAFFGYPAAGESDAEQAVRAALVCVAATRGMRAADGQNIDVRIGIATGTVVVGDVLEAWGSTERGVIGETPNVAARLQAAAAPGTVVVCDATHRLCGAWFKFDDLGVTPMKGFDTGLQAWRVQSASAVTGRFEAQHLGQLPLVGRQAELQRLQQAWRSASDGHGSMMLIEGEAGIGKSRLLQALKSGVDALSSTTIPLHCLPHQGASAFEPVVRHLAAALHFDPGEDALVRRDKLAAFVPTDFAQEDRISLQALLGIAESLSERSRLSPNEQRESIFAAMIHLLLARARQKPVLLLWEDIHWSDRSSLELLQRIVPRLEGAAILLVATTRPEEGQHAVPLPEGQVIGLKGLPVDEVAQIAQGVAGSPLASGALEEIAARTDGIPLFVEEITRSLLEEGSLVKQADHYELAGALARTIPTTLKATLAARLDRLGPARALAQVASVLGRDFPVSLLAELWEESQMPLMKGLATLTQARLITPQSSPTSPRYSFNHALLQSAAYDSLLRAQRRDLHRRVAEVIERSIPDLAAASPEMVARHFRLGEQPLRAAEYLTRAGALAQSRSAFVEATTELDEALAIVRRLPDTQQDKALELKILIPLAKLRYALGGHVSLEVRDLLARALELLVDGPTLPSFIVAQGLYQIHVSRGEWEQAERANEVMWTLQQKTGYQDMQRHCMRARGLLALYQGDYAAATKALDEATQPLTEPSRVEAQEPMHSIVSAFGLYAHALSAQGRFAEALAIEENALRQRRAFTRAYDVGLAISLTCTARAVRHDLKSILPLTAELLAVARKLGKRHWLEDNALLVELTANAINHQPESERDAKYLEEFDQFYLHWPTWVPFHASKIAEALAERGDQAAALQFLEKASKAQDQTGAYWMASEILHLEARLALMAGDNETAITKLRLAIDTAQRQEAHFFLLKALTTLLGAFPDGGPVADARQLFVKTLVPMRAYVDNVHVQAALGLEANWIEV